MKGMKGFNKRLSIGMAAAIMAGTILSGSAVTWAAEDDTDQTSLTTAASTTQTSGTGIDMSTDYPGITVKAGETTSFTLDFASLSGESCDAALSVTDIPEGWTGYFKGSSSQITKIHINGQPTTADDATTATFSLTLPDDVTEGTYEVDLEADAGDYGSDTLALEIVVDETETGESTFTSEYPEQQGAAGTSFSFDTTLVNNRGIGQTYSLSAETESGWTVTFTTTDDSTQVASIDVDAGSSTGLTVAVTPPETVTQGDYTIPLTAVSATDTLSLDLTVSITGSYTVELTTPSGNLSVDAYSNSKKAVTLKINNTGNVDLTNLNLTSSAPTDWEVSFDESTIDTLEAGASKEVTAYITPDSDAMTGDYVTTITVSNDEATSSAQFRVSVKTRTSWGIVAIVIILILLAALRFIFKKYGRR